VLALHGRLPLLPRAFLCAFDETSARPAELAPVVVKLLGAAHELAELVVRPGYETAEQTQHMHTCGFLAVLVHNELHQVAFAVEGRASVADSAQGLGREEGVSDGGHAPPRVAFRDHGPPQLGGEVDAHQLVVHDARHEGLVLAPVGDTAGHELHFLKVAVLPLIRVGGDRHAVALAHLLEGILRVLAQVAVVGYGRREQDRVLVVVVHHADHGEVCGTHAHHTHVLYLALREVVFASARRHHHHRLTLAVVFWQRLDGEARWRRAGHH
jgi:hypothetical protein